MGRPFAAVNIIVLLIAAVGILDQHRQSTAPSPKVNPAKVRSGDQDWRRAEQEVDAEQPYLRLHAEKAISKNLGKYVLHHGNLRKRSIALTFDDGPHPIFTLQLLKILRQEHVPATFFVIGFMAEKYPELVQTIKADGQTIGNHSYSHVTLTKIPYEQTLAEYRANNDVIERICKVPVKYCRPPGGDFNSSVIKAGALLGLTTVLWTDDPGDYANPGDQILYEKEVDKLSNGAIVLLHDGSQDTLDTLRKFIQTARKRGYTFVSLDELQKD
jgi:peptidoglycan/xylan/chitin deacetylase (PgdA/CDA1 family)